MKKRGAHIVLGGGGRLLVAFSIPLLFSWLIASSVIIPTIIPNASATESPEKNTSTSTTDKGYSLSIAVPKTVTIDLIPDPNGSFSYSELNTNVTTTNPTGYTLAFNASTNDRALTNTNTNITTNNTIPSITTSTTYTNFPTNSWAYSTVDNSITNVTDSTVESLTFKPIPTTSSSTQDKQLKVTNTADNFTTPIANTNTKLIIGLKADNNLASGTYAGQLTFSVVANYKPNFFPETLTTMQGMTSAICSSVDTPTKDATIPVTTKNAYTDPTTQVPQVTLTDVRGKNGSGTLASPATGSNIQTYVVRKLADGNCWMSQNLNMTLATNVTLNSTTSDLNSKTTWTPQNNTQTTEGTVWAQNGGDVARSFEPGENIYFPNGVGTGTQDSYYNYSGYANSGDPWYHIGNYYNWYAATAGSGTAAMGSDGTEVQAIDSICPKNWKLPDNVGDKSFINLTSTTYGLIDNDTASATKLLEQPLTFVRSGGYDWSGRVYNKGDRGYWWSTAAYSSTNSHNLYTNPSRVFPQNGNYKGNGLSVRCVAR